jgi:hypothetical protein
MSEDESIGYGRPPRKHQFKKGQSGCPDGGRKQKQAKKAKAKKEELEPSKMVQEWFLKKRKVRINGKICERTLLELALAQLEEDALVHKDPVARKLFFDTAHRNGWLKAPAARRKNFVLVVNAIQTAEQWAKDTEGELLPRDPLHGIPGAEGLSTKTPGRRGLIPDQDD